MRLHRLTPGDWIRTLIVGLAVSVLTAAIMMGLMSVAPAPAPKPLGLAFARTVLGDVPPPFGFLFHTAWVMACAAFYVALFRDRLGFARAFWLAAALWALVLVFFFPVVGWGFFGLAESPKLMVATAVSHLLFAVLLWGGCRIAFRGGPTEPGNHH